MAARLFTKFIIVLVPVFLVISGVGLNWVAEYDLRGLNDVLTSRIGNRTAKISGALERNRGSLNKSISRDLMATLLSDPAIVCAELRDKQAGRLIAAAPIRVGCKGRADGRMIKLSVGFEEPAMLQVRYTTDEIANARKSRREYSFVVVFLGLLAAVGASWFGFRWAVGNPLRQLLNSIRHTAETGERQPVSIPSADELGIVIGAYNEMQGRLCLEEDRVRTALTDLDHVYNNTPALLYSTGIGGDITNVSTHWLESTGYRREQVIGRMITEFMTDSNVAHYQAAAQNHLLKSGYIAEIPVQIRCQDGRLLDVLVAAVANNSNKLNADGFLCIMSDISKLKSAERNLRKLATTDHLSGLPNRFILMDFLDQLLVKDANSCSRSAVLFIDLDNFKWINDTYGHHAGDKLLIDAAERLKKCVDKDDFVARLGGDEFAIICSSVFAEADVINTAEQILADLARPFDLGTVKGFVTASIGIAYLSNSMSDPEEALRLADLAMYKSKKTGRNTYSIYSEELSAESRARLQFEHSMRDGLENGWFSLYFQPIVRLSDMQTVGTEALLRLSTPSLGSISPSDFIPVAEETGQIEEIGQWVLREGVKRLQEIEADNHNKDLYLTMNLSPRQLNGHFVNEVKELMKKNKSLSQKVILEVTETAIADNMETAIEFLNEIRTTGIRIALDDFGTGYSSLNYLNQFPVDIIKLDRSLVRNVGTTDICPEESHRSAALIRAIVALAGELGLKVVAEGIETLPASELLRKMNVDYGQGYLYSPPLPLKEFKTWSTALSGGDVASARDVAQTARLRIAS